MLSSAVVLGLVLLLPMNGQATSVEDALRLLEEQPQGRVSAEAARTAVERIRRGDLDVVRLAHVAAAGGAHEALADALAALVSAGTSVGECLTAVASYLPPPHRDRFAAGLTPFAAGSLFDLALEERFGSTAIEVGVWRADTDQVLSLVGGWSWSDLDGDRGRARHALAAIGRTGQVRYFLPLVELRLPAAFATQHGETLKSIVFASPEAADLALDQADVSLAHVIRSLGGVRLSEPARWERAAQLLRDYVVGLGEDPRAYQDDVGAAVVEAATELYVPELLPVLSRLALDASTATRVAALRSIGLLGETDEQTIDLLMSLLEDPDLRVQGGAHEALSRRTGQQLSCRLALWQRWRKETVLPPPSEEPPAVKLERLREIKAIAERRALERGRR